MAHHRVTKILRLRIGRFYLTHDAQDMLALFSRSEIAAQYRIAGLQLVDIGNGTTLFVFADFLVLGQLLQLGQGIATHVAHGHLGIFGHATRLLGVTLAGLLGQGRHRHTDGGTGAAWVQTQIRGHDRFFNSCDQRLVVRRRYPLALA